MSTTGMGSSFALNIGNALLTGAGSPAFPATVYAKMHIGAPGAAGTANPAAYTNRPVATFGTGSITGTNMVWSNSSAVNLGTVSNTENITWFSLWNAASGGTLVAVGTVAGGSVTSGSSPTFPIGALTVSMGIAT